METDINLMMTPRKYYDPFHTMNSFTFVGANFNVLRENCIFVYTYIR